MYISMIHIKVCFFSFVLGLCWQRIEDNEGERQQSQQYPANCNTPD